MKALDTNVLVRFLLNDDKVQAAKARAVFEKAEETGTELFVTTPVILEMMWVLSAVYELAREDLLGALELLTGMPVLEFENCDEVRQLIVLGRTTSVDLPDLLIGLSGKAAGCQATLTFEKGLTRTGLFERL